jgi:hypothetical protein
MLRDGARCYPPKPPGGAVPSGARISVEPRAESRTGNDGSRFPARRSIARPSDHPVGESGNLRGPKSPRKNKWLSALKTGFSLTDPYALSVSPTARDPLTRGGRSTPRDSRTWVYLFLDAAASPRNRKKRRAAGPACGSGLGTVHARRQARGVSKAHFRCATSNDDRRSVFSTHSRGALRRATRISSVRESWSNLSWCARHACGKP